MVIIFINVSVILLYMEIGITKKYPESAFSGNGGYFGKEGTGDRILQMVSTFYKTR